MRVAPSSEAARRLMLDRLAEFVPPDSPALRAMAQTPREMFVDETLQGRAYDDQPWSIGHGQTISAPSIVATMTHLLDVRPDSRVLDIGTGSGYQAAVLARLAAEVYSVERIKPLLDVAAERLGALGLRNVRLHLGDGTAGWPEHAPYDRILVAAGAPDVPTALADELADGGVLVIPIGPRDQQVLLHATKHNGRLVHVRHCDCRFVPLIGEAGWPE